MSVDGDGRAAQGGKGGRRLRRKVGELEQPRVHLGGLSLLEEVGRGRVDLDPHGVEEHSGGCRALRLVRQHTPVAELDAAREELLLDRRDEVLVRGASVHRHGVHRPRAQVHAVAERGAVSRGQINRRPPGEELQQRPVDLHPPQQLLRGGCLCRRRPCQPGRRRRPRVPLGALCAARRIKLAADALSLRVALLDRAVEPPAGRVVIIDMGPQSLHAPRVHRLLLGEPQDCVLLVTSRAARVGGRAARSFTRLAAVGVGSPQHGLMCKSGLGRDVVDAAALAAEPVDAGGMGKTATVAIAADEHERVARTAALSAPEADFRHHFDEATGIRVLCPRRF